MVGVRNQSFGKKAATAVLSALPLFAGCASTVDTVTSQRFKEAPFHTMFHSDDPLEVLKTSDEADLRAKAMLEIKEPKRSGRSDEEQFQVLQLLATAATSDRHALCRMRAIEALGRFEDPRSAHIIARAYELAGQETAPEEQVAESGVTPAGRRTRARLNQPPTFTADTIITIQCRAVEALAKKQTPEALALLCQVATTPAKQEAKKKDDIDMLAPPTTGHEQTDLRIAALRALGSYKGEAAAAQALYQVMTTERGPALRNRAHQSLMKVTGQDYPPDASEWRVFLHLNETRPANVSR